MIEGGPLLAHPLVGERAHEIHEGILEFKVTDGRRIIVVPQSGKGRS